MISARAAVAAVGGERGSTCELAQLIAGATSNYRRASAKLRERSTTHPPCISLSLERCIADAGHARRFTEIETHIIFTEMAISPDCHCVSIVVIVHVALVCL